MDSRGGGYKVNGSILIISRNSLHLTKLTVKSALAQDLPCDVMVIDNDSHDGTLQWLKSKSIAWCSTLTQKSLSYCWNKGIKAFFDAGATEVLVCNNDIELLPNTYRLLNLVGGPFVTAVGVSLRDQFNPVPNLVVPGNSRPHPDFSCFMIRPEIIDRVGWFDESYFPAYCEDSDYHVRMHKAHINACCVDIPFFHHAAATLKNASPSEVIKIRRGSESNRERFHRQYGCLPGTPEYENLFSQAILV